MERTREVSRTTLLWMIVAVLAILPLAEVAGGWVFLGSLAAVLGGLGWLGTNWGADSRDGRDWRPRS